jgi:hypothetical protein
VRWLPCRAARLWNPRESVPQPTAPEVLSIRETVAPSLSFLTPHDEGTPVRSPSGLVSRGREAVLDTFVTSDDEGP